MADSVKTINYAGGTLVFDLKSLLNRTQAFSFVVVGEDRDLAAQAALPTLGEASYFNQQIISGFLTYGISDQVSFVAKAAYELWKSKQTFYPLNIQTTELGSGFDFKLDPYLSGLALNLAWICNAKR